MIEINFDAPLGCTNAAGGWSSLDSDPLLYNVPPNRAQVRAISFAALLSLVGVFAVLPFRQIQLARIDAFIPMVDTALFVGDLVIVTLLLAEALVLRSKPLIALGTGYFFTSLLIIPHALTFPWAFSPTGLLGAGINTTSWLYYFWHCGLPVSAIAYSLLKSSPVWPHTASLAPRTVTIVWLIFTTVLAGALTLLATVGQPLLPQIMSDDLHPYAEVDAQVAIAVALLTVVAMVMVWRNRRSALDLWLLLALWAWLLDLFMSTVTPTRFGLGWYAGRTLGLLSSIFVLLIVLAHTSMLYARTILHVKARRWEQENRFMIRDAIGASIAHELRQPLQAITLNVRAAQLHVPKPDDFTSSILDEVLGASQRANDILVGARAIFGQSPTQRSPANINDIIHDTLGLASRTIREQRASVNLQLDESLRRVNVNRLQIEQVFYNLFMNAAEAMRSMADRPRILTIRTGSDEMGLLISVEDTGPGITAAEQEKIFEFSYTTKAHGMGMGLPICRSVITAHGGSLRAILGAPTGAIFEIYLPYDGSAETAG